MGDEVVEGEQYLLVRYFYNLSIFPKTHSALVSYEKLKNN